jgi:16S rRNA (guanine966-N2)-methyltransferase
VRIVAGQWRGRRLKTPKSEAIRPTADRVKEAWMSIVSPWIPEARVLDLFAGSGALGIETLSRGAASVDFVENQAEGLQLLADNLALVDAGDTARVHRADALRFIEGLEPHSYDVAFADPPYDLGLATKIAEQWLKVPFAGILGIEHRRDERLPAGGDARRYGSTVITFYRG